MLRRKMMIFLVVVMGLFLGTAKRVMAVECSMAELQLKSGIVLNKSYPENTVLFETTGRTITIPSGQSVCGYNKSLGSGGGDLYGGYTYTPYAAVFTCGTNGKFSEKSCFSSGLICKQSGTTASCSGAKYCEGIVDPWSGQPSVWRKNGEKACLDKNNVGVCNGFLDPPRLESSPIINCAATNQVCKNYSGGLTWVGGAKCYAADCTQDGITAGESEKVCLNDQIRQCKNGNFNTIIDDCKNMNGCVDAQLEGEDPKCVPLTSARCDKLPNGQSVTAGMDGDFICSSDNTLYYCDKTKNPPYYTLRQNCNEGDKVCRAYARSADRSSSCESKDQQPGGGLLINGDEVEKTMDVFCTGSSDWKTNPKIYTPLGCIPVKTSEFVPWLLSLLFSIAGGIAFLMMVYGFVLIATSSGDEKKMAGAKETITSAITGLLVCIFALFILRLIAVNILKIPGL